MLLGFKDVAADNSQKMGSFTQQFHLGKLFSFSYSNRKSMKQWFVLMSGVFYYIFSSSIQQSPGTLKYNQVI